MPLTPKQKKVLEFVKKFSGRHDSAASLREIGKHIGVSPPATVHQHLTALERKGFLGREKSQPRSITIQPLESIESPYSGAVGVNSMTLPIVGSANCGPAGTLAEANIEGYLKISTSLPKRRAGLI